MVLKISSIGLISLAILPAIFLLTLRIMGSSSDLTVLLFRLIIAEAISLLLALVLVLQLKGKTKVPIPQT